MRLASGGFSWIVTSSVLTVLCFLATVVVSGVLLSIAWFFFLFFLVASVLLVVFFRDPPRTVGRGVVAAADGCIREIAEVSDDDVGEAWLVSTFMNIYNVHVNRMPLDGKICSIRHISGGHLPAFQKESERNEQVIYTIETSYGMIKVVLIAGTVARRIVPYVSEGMQIHKGGRIGLIRLGSRVDVFLPRNTITCIVSKNDRLKAGEDSIATILDG